MVKYGKQEIFKGIEKMRERETLFNEHLEELKLSRKSKEEELKQAARGRIEKVRELPWLRAIHRCLVLCYGC